eukprot:TRINITY_DN2647_c0_g1_i7.p3 TRINITY_DN2647_c0_g1~~TRINITY_DN2647_c0_g1_i7.p3  ORF type:complete len:118 (+),score=47.38 TRINITY_DN2647_c0_g1_i7:534-887(+)
MVEMMAEVMVEMMPEMMVEMMVEVMMRGRWRCDEDVGGGVMAEVEVMAEVMVEMMVEVMTEVMVQNVTHPTKGANENYNRKPKFIRQDRKGNNQITNYKKPPNSMENQFLQNHSVDK